jgi:hypothetical protein
MHYLDKATRDGVYQLQEDILEPDPSVVDLNSDLSERQRACTSERVRPVCLRGSQAPVLTLPSRSSKAGQSLPVACRARHRRPSADRIVRSKDLVRWSRCLIAVSSGWFIWLRRPFLIERSWLARQSNAESPTLRASLSAGSGRLPARPGCLSVRARSWSRARARLERTSDRFPARTTESVLFCIRAW